MKKRTLLLPLLLTWHLATAQSNACFLHYITDQGLSNDHITAITKDRLGFLWVATVNGLNRFNGRSFKIFRHDPHNDNSLPHNNVWDIVPAPDGGLWVATFSGLCRLDPHRLQIRRVPLFDNDGAIKKSPLGKIAFDSKGMLWVTSESGLHQIDPATGKQVFFQKTEKPTLGWFMLLIDREDRLWMVKETVRRYDPRTRTFKTFENADFLQGGALNVAEDFSGTIWAGTWGTGIWRYEPQRDQFVQVPSPPLQAVMLLPDTTVSGRPFLWVGGGGSGLGVYYLDNNRFTEFKSDPRDPLTHNNYITTALFRDASNGDVWIGTEVGLEHYAPATIRFGRAMIPSEKDMNQYSLVSAVVCDRTDPGGQRYFVGVWGTGVFIWDRTSGLFRRLPPPPASKLTPRGVFNLLQDSKGRLWSCLNNGLRRYDPQTGAWRDYNCIFQHPEWANAFLGGLEDRRGNLWFASNLDGLFRYNPLSDRVEQVFWQKELLNDRGNMSVPGLSEDAQGRLWLACNDGGLVRFDPATGAWKRIPLLTGKISCGAVHAARNGRIYVSLYSDFLELDSEGNLLRAFSQQDKLKTNRLMFIVEDRQGKIWMNSEFLLHCFDPETGTFRYYGKTDGLFSNAMTDGLSITPDGEVFVGFQNAFNFFYPDRLRQNQQPPPLAVTSIRVMNKEREIPARSPDAPEADTVLTLRPGENFFEVEFAALNFNQQERNRYAYRLEGFNDDWVYTERPVATFTNLDGGTYRLHMKAANNDGVWNEQGTALTIRVIPPFHRTGWFVLLLVAAGVSAVAGAFWLRQLQQRRLEAFREGLARDLHDEMGSTLSSIRFFSEFAARQIDEDKPAAMSLLQRIGQSAGALSESLQDIVWAMKSKNDPLEDLAARMTEFGLRLLEARNVGFKTFVGTDFSGKKLRPDVRRNVYLIFKEAVNNAAKYADATEVELHLALKKGLLLMKISDNGKGFDPEAGHAAERGNGLQNMQQRAADVGGQLTVFSQPGAGTRVELRVKT